MSLATLSGCLGLALAGHSSAESLQLKLAKSLSIAGPLLPSSPQSEPMAAASPGTASPPDRVPPGKGTPDAVEEVIFQVDVNRQGLDETVILLKRLDGTYLVSGPDLQRWRIREPAVTPHLHEGTRYFPVSTLQGSQISIDEVRQTMELSVAGAAFQSTVEAGPRGRQTSPIRPQFGGFLNYNLSYTESDSSRLQNGVFELGLFNGKGVFTTNVLGADLYDPKQWRRLDSTYTADFPDKLTSFRLGDGITRAGSWGRAVRYGGIQYSTNFSTQPGFVRTPIQSVSGIANLPSTVDVYVNNALVRRSQVPPGPFVFENIPMISGSGEVRTVVRDLLGREQVVTQPFYGAAQLLKAGVDDYSYDIGAVRRDYGLVSNAYGSGFGAATFRRGLTDDITGEVRGEYSVDVQAIGLSGGVRLGSLGVVNSTLARSSGEAGAGGLFGASLERNTGSLSGSVQGQWISTGFRQIGMSPQEVPRLRQLSMSLGYQLGQLGGLGGSLVRQDFRDQPSARIASITYSVPIRNLASLSFTALKVFGVADSQTILASLVIPFSSDLSAAMTFDKTTTGLDRDGQRSQSVSLQKSLPFGDGFGYRLQSRNRDLQASGTWQTSRGTYTFEASQTGVQQAMAYRVGVQGGLGFVGNHVFASRLISDSFGIIRVADYPQVRILQDNQLAARTDDEGIAVLPRLRAYDRNQINIDQRDLPFDASIKSTQLEVVPYYRSGVFVDFPIRKVRAGVLNVDLDSGEPVPSGALARLNGQDEEFPVALGGQVYIEGLENENTVIITWKKQRCDITVRYPDTTDPLPGLGNYICKGMKP